RFGFRTVNVVRRRDLAEELLRAGGGTAICTSDESIEDSVKAMTGGAGVPFALDAVGCGPGSQAVRGLASGGRLAAYGTLSGEPIPVDPRTFLLANCRIEGFWLSPWVAEQGILTMLGLFRTITRLMRQGVLVSEIGGEFPLDQIKAAVAEAEKPGRHGKVLL